MKKTIAIICGGDSSEHDVSLRSGAGIYSFFNKEKYNCYIVDLKSGEQKTVNIDLPRERFENWDVATQTMRVVPGHYELLVGPSSDDNHLQRLDICIDN